ncbi:TPA: transcription antitermination protein NusB, partial [Candidatus Avacholeplasma faecigallinarum]|nr:transcription antitermination protein NusB [Candidatus Avacholeplasma faecigallinarum]
KRIVINEALEITKQFSDQGDHKATSFNNKLLETIYKNTLELK